MREILFRAKDFYTKEWVYGMLHGVKDYYAMQTLQFNIHDIIPETVGQYTGLTDKNGNKIFEGDIVKNSCCVTLRSGDNEDKWDFTIMGVVTFRKGGFWVKGSEIDFPVDNEYEVIGNVIDDPELLEGQK